MSFNTQNNEQLLKHSCSSVFFLLTVIYCTFTLLGYCTGQQILHPQSLFSGPINLSSSQIIVGKIEPLKLNSKISYYLGHFRSGYNSLKKIFNSSGCSQTQATYELADVCVMEVRELLFRKKKNKKKKSMHWTVEQQLHNHVPLENPTMEPNKASFPRWLWIPDARNLTCRRSFCLLSCAKSDTTTVDNIS